MHIVRPKSNYQTNISAKANTINIIYFGGYNIIYIITMLMTTILSFNTITSPSMVENLIPKPIDTFILAYDAMYNAPEDFKTDYLILDMESLDFAETTPEDRKKMIEHFRKYNKVVLNASLFKLKEI